LCGGVITELFLKKGIDGEEDLVECLSNFLCPKDIHYNMPFRYRNMGKEKEPPHLRQSFIFSNQSHHHFSISKDILQWFLDSYGILHFSLCFHFRPLNQAGF